MDISRRNVMLTAALAVSAATLARTSVAQTMGDEMRDHPRIVRAIHEMEDAVRYMEEAPHDFGGFKAHSARYRIIADGAALPRAP